MIKSRVIVIGSLCISSLLILIVGFSNCGNWGVTRNGQPLGSKNLDSGSHIVPPPEIPCIDIQGVPEGTGTAWHKSIAEDTREPLKFCFTTSLSAPITVNAQISGNIACSEALTMELYDSTGAPSARGLQGNRLSHGGSVVGAYALYVQTPDVSCQIRVDITQAPISSEGIGQDGRPADSTTGTGNFVVPNVDAKKGTMKSWLFPVAEDEVTIEVSTRNHASVSCGEKRLTLRHSDLLNFPDVTATSVSGEPSVRLSQLGGRCGYFKPGCPERLPGGMYEVRIEGLADGCTLTDIAIKPSK